LVPSTSSCVSSCYRGSSLQTIPFGGNNHVDVCVSISVTTITIDPINNSTRNDTQLLSLIPSAISLTTSITIEIDAPITELEMSVRQQLAVALNVNINRLIVTITISTGIGTSSSLPLLQPAPSPSAAPPSLSSSASSLSTQAATPSQQGNVQISFKPENSSISDGVVDGSSDEYGSLESVEWQSMRLLAMSFADQITNINSSLSRALIASGILIYIPTQETYLHLLMPLPLTL
jgi:hypothetical protein